jgi:hypothetical protein
MFLSHTVVWSRDRDCTFACFQNRVVNSQRFPFFFFKENCVILLRESLSRCSFTPSQVDKLVNMMKPVLPSLNVFILHVNKVKESAKKRETEEKLKVTV